KLDLRRMFKSTAYYNAAVPIGADGRARITFQLPDNVTTYRVMAVVVDGETRAGAGQAAVLARKPLIVQPVLPRFVSPGDRLRLEARAFNGTDAKGVAELAATFRGLVLEAGAAPAASAEVAGGKDAAFGWNVVVPDDATGEVTVRLAGKLGAASDAVEVKLPVVDPGKKRKIVVQRLVSGGDKLVVPLPAERLPGTLAVELLASTTALSQLKDAVAYLMDYPNGCIEQTTSTAYPLVVLGDLLPEMGVTVDAGKLREFSEAGVKKILSFQTAAGGLSYWPGGTQPHAFATAFGLTALIEAKKRGYDVPAPALARMADFLELSLRSGAITGEMPHGSMADADTRALFVMTLGRLGRTQASYISTLWAQRDKLTPFGLSFLAAAVAEGGADKAMLGPILAAIREAGTEETSQLHYDPKAGAGRARDDWSMGSHLRTHAGALLAFTSEKAADRTVASKLLTGLLARQRGGMWGNTQENVFGIMAIAQLVGTASADAPEVGVKVNGVALDKARILATSKRGVRVELREADLPRGADTVALELTSGGKPVFATMRVEYIAKLDAVSRAPRSAGFTVSRRYETLDGAPLDRKIKLGSLVRVRVRVDAAAANHYVAIDDKLPAGLEPLNAALATTETVAAGAVTPQLRRALDRLSYSELRDARVAFFVDEMPAGSYDFVYVARATTPGTFIRPAASAEAMYQTDVAGSSAIDDIVVE
ncbi:MAG: hypothetical protein KIT31_43295, partial [Deltaproteobacteria bacterium]|nr:hypothetical protein [Deltaproteobacteria bacterium]